MSEVGEAGIAGLDRDQLERRVAQEIDAARQRPLAPSMPPNPIMTPTSPPPAPQPSSRLLRVKLFLRAVPVLGDALAAFNRVRRGRRWRDRLRRLPLLGDLLVWANAVRHAPLTRRQLAELAVEHGSLAGHLGAFARHTDNRFDLVRAHLETQDEGTRDLSELFRALDDRLNAERRTVEALRQEVGAFTQHAAELRAELILLQRRLSRAEAAPATVSAPAMRPEAAAPTSDALDAYYVAFEDCFRGSPDEIKERLAVYLEHLRVAGVAAMGKPVLDLGCGRGEWLELLGEASLPAYGIDLNTVNVARCREAGLDVRGEDAVGHLRSLPNGSLAAVTAFHLIEHLPFELLVELVEEAHRVLAPGGLLIAETPNPENVLVGSLTFYNDPTHRHPIPPGVARFLLQNRGFMGTEVLRLHPRPDSDRVPAGSELAVRFNELFYGAQDYAVIGRR